MKPRFIGGDFHTISVYLQKLTDGLFLTRELIDITPVSVAASTAAEQTFTIPRLATDESVIVELPAAQTAGVGILGARVSAAETLAITFINPTGGAVVPVAGEYRLIRMFT